MSANKFMPGDGAINVHYSATGHLSRRDFLKVTAAGVGGIAIGSSGSAFGKTSGMSPGNALAIGEVDHPFR